MKLIGIYLAGALLCATSLRAQTIVQPSISSPVDASQAVPETQRSTPEKVIILPNGIISIFGTPQVLFKTVDPSSDRQKSYLLNEKQRRDDIEVISINQGTGVVTFNNHGTKQEIRLPNASVITMPTPSEDGSTNDSPHLEIPRPGELGSGIPPYLGGDENTGQATHEPLTPDQQILMIEAQRAYYRAKGDPESLRIANSLPPTAMTPSYAYESSANFISSPTPPAPASQP
jgi:hypothetical protein